MQIPPISMARGSPVVFSLQSALVVSGGLAILGLGDTPFTAEVKLYKWEITQRYKTDLSPTAY